MIVRSGERSGPAVMIEHADRFLEAHRKDETFEQAIVRANAWLRTVLESPAARASMSA